MLMRTHTDQADAHVTDYRAEIARVEAAFDAIGFPLNYATVMSFYQLNNRAADSWALMQSPPTATADRLRWMRQCVADANALRGRDCPTCGL